MTITKYSHSCSPLYTHGTKKMADNSVSNNSSVCSVFDTYLYVIAAAVSAGSAMVSALCCIFVICLIFLLKKHYFFIQRLILYHCLATLLRSFSTMLRFHRLSAYPNSSSATNTLCVISGFTNQVTSWFLMVDYSVITFTLLMTAVFHKNVARLERLYVVLIFVLPLTFNWIPFIGNSYGRDGPWCWIRNLNYDDCTDFQLGIVLRNVLLSVPLYIVVIGLIATYIFIIIYLVYQRCCKRGGDAHNSATEQLKHRLDEQVWPLLFYPIGVVLLNIVPLINRIYISVNVDNPSYALWIIGAILSPLQGGYIAVVYVLDRDTLKRLTYSNLVATLCKRKDEVSEYPIEKSWRSDSILDNEESDTPYKRFIESDEKLLNED